MDVTEAYNRYIEKRVARGDVDSTIRSQRHRLGLFVDWLAEQEHGLQDVDGMDMHQFHVEAASRLEDGSRASDRTLQGRMNDVQNFLEWCATVGAVPPELPGKVDVPNPDPSSRDNEVDATASESILEFLEQFRYASRDHVIMLLFWRTAGRMGDVTAIDLQDYHPDGTDETDAPHVEIRHRPPNTRLKNGDGGERLVNLRRETCDVIDAYVDHNRYDVTDDQGRDPLITSRQGRPSTTTYKRTMYRLTRPCVYSNECPHGRSQSDCEATQLQEYASRCPSSESCHAVRRGALTELCRKDKPLTVISDRCDVTPEVLDQHYNQMTAEEKMEQRRDYL